METGFSQEKRRLIVSAAWTLSSTVISCKRPNSPKRESAADLLRRAASKLGLLFSLRGILVTLFLNPLAQFRQFAIRKMGDQPRHGAAAYTSAVAGIWRWRRRRGGRWAWRCRGWRHRSGSWAWRRWLDRVCWNHWGRIHFSCLTCGTCSLALGFGCRLDFRCDGGGGFRSGFRGLQDDLFGLLRLGLSHTASDGRGCVW